MRIISIHIYSKSQSTDPICICSAFELKDFGYFERGTIKEFINFNSRLVIGRTQKEQRLEVALEKGICYAYVTSDNIGIAIITDEEYPKRVAFDLIYKTMQQLNEFIYNNKINIESYKQDSDIKFSYISTLIVEWQDPRNSKFK
jgi:synaptobrevin family protein YKT6